MEDVAPPAHGIVPHRAEALSPIWDSMARRGLVIKGQTIQILTNHFKVKVSKTVVSNGSPGRDIPAVVVIEDLPPAPVVPAHETVPHRGEARYPNQVPMAQRGLGRQGPSIQLFTNHFKVKVSKTDGCFYQYNVVSSRQWPFITRYRAALRTQLSRRQVALVVVKKYNTIQLNQTRMRIQMIESNITCPPVLSFTGAAGVSNPHIQRGGESGGSRSVSKTDFFHGTKGDFPTDKTLKQGLRETKEEKIPLKKQRNVLYPIEFLIPVKLALCFGQRYNPSVQNSATLAEIRTILPRESYHVIVNLLMYLHNGGYYNACVMYAPHAHFSYERANLQLSDTHLYVWSEDGSTKVAEMHTLAFGIRPFNGPDDQQFLYVELYTSNLRAFKIGIPREDFDEFIILVLACQYRYVGVNKCFYMQPIGDDYEGIWFTVASDAGHDTWNNTASMGGYIRDQQSNFVVGVYGQIVAGNSYEAEMVGVLEIFRCFVWHLTNNPLVIDGNFVWFKNINVEAWVDNSDVASDIRWRRVHRRSLAGLGRSGKEEANLHDVLDIKRRFGPLSWVRPIRRQGHGGPDGMAKRGRRHPLRFFYDPPIDLNNILLKEEIGAPCLYTVFSESTSARKTTAPIEYIWGNDFGLQVPGPED